MCDHYMPRTPHRRLLEAANLGYADGGIVGDAGDVVEALSGPYDTQPTLHRLAEESRRLRAARNHNEQYL